MRCRKDANKHYRFHYEEGLQPILYYILYPECTSWVVWFVFWSVPPLLKERERRKKRNESGKQTLYFWQLFWEENHLQVLCLLFCLLFLPPCSQKHFGQSCHELSSGRKRKLLNETQISDIQLSILLSVRIKHSPTSPSRSSDVLQGVESAGGVVFRLSFDLTGMHVASTSWRKVVGMPTLQCFGPE